MSRGGRSHSVSEPRRRERQKSEPRRRELCHRRLSAASRPCPAFLQGRGLQPARDHQFPAGDCTLQLEIARLQMTLAACTCPTWRVHHCPSGQCTTRKAAGSPASTCASLADARMALLAPGATFVLGPYRKWFSARSASRRRARACRATRLASAGMHEDAVNAQRQCWQLLLTQWPSSIFGSALHCKAAMLAVDPASVSVA